MLDKFFKGGKKREPEAIPASTQPVIPAPSAPVQTTKEGSDVIVTGYCAVCRRTFPYSINKGPSGWGTRVQGQAITELSFGGICFTCNLEYCPSIMQLGGGETGIAPG